MADIDTEGGEGLQRYRAVINGVETLLKLTPQRAKQMGLTEIVPRETSTAPTEAEMAAAEAAEAAEAEASEPTSTEASHKKRTVAGARRE